MFPVLTISDSFKGLSIFNYKNTHTQLSTLSTLIRSSISISSFGESSSLKED
jgi:hypothetical protein